MVGYSNTASVSRKPMIQRMLRKLGAVKITIAITTLSSVLSVVLYMVLSSIWEEISVTGVFMSIVIPAIVAPLLSYSFLRLLVQLDLLEDTVRQSVAEYRDIFENVSDFLYFHDLEGYFKKTNMPFKIKYGYSEGDLLNMNARDLIPQRYENQFEDYLRRVIKEGKAEGLMRVVTKGGQERIVEYRNSLISNSTGPIGVRGSARDITERIEAEKALRESEGKYRSLVERLDDVIYDMDENGIITYVSPAIESITGYTPAEVTGRSFSEFVCEEDLSDAKLHFHKALSGEVKAVEYRIQKKSRGICWVCTSSRPISEDGRVVGVRGTLTDIDERKRAEEEKKRLEKRLLEAQKMEAIGTLAGGVAHDLNNMLVGLVSYPELLLMQIPQDSPLRGSILTIRKSGEKAAAIVQDLLTLARRGVVAPEVVNLNSIVSEYLKSPEHEKVHFHHPKVTIETNLQEDLLNVLGSPVHMSKTVMNLVSNAAEAMPSGGKIVISTEARYVDKPLQGYDDVQEGEYVTISVSDTGVGISLEDAKKIFEPFYTKKAMGRSGTGLGMTVVRGTVNDHNGYIGVETVEGKGTTFTLYLPATRQELTRDTSTVSTEDHLGRGESVLVVDDVEEQREIASMILEKLGYCVASVSSGEEAVDYMKNNSVDLLVLDMIMEPGIDGLETYKRIRDFHPHQKAVLVSGYSETECVKKAQQLGAGAYVKKPYTVEKIGLAIRAELDSWKPLETVGLS